MINFANDECGLNYSIKNKINEGFLSPFLNKKVIFHLFINIKVIIGKFATK